MMGPGLIYTFEGRVGICVALIVLGFILTVVLSVIRFVLHKQTAREFGVGWLILSAIFIGPALLALIVVTSVEVFHRTPFWVWPVAASVSLLVVGVLVVRSRRQPAPKHLRPDPVPEPTSAPGWSMPIGTEQWDR